MDFSFISDETLRTLVERDKNELDKCAEGKLAKATMVLSGSIIEAVLVDYFLAFPPTGKTAEEVLKADLFNLIEWAVQTGVLAPKYKDLSSVIRGYRNLIHPGKEYRLKEDCDVDSASVAASLVNMIVKDIAKNYSTKRGYSAQKAFEKVLVDPQCAPIFVDMVSSMAMAERIKLFKQIPEACVKDTDMPETVVSSFVLLHDVLSKQLGPAVVKEEAAKVYEFVQTKSKEETLYYFRFFYQHLGLVDPAKRMTVLNYILGIAARAYPEDLKTYRSWGLFQTIGQYVNSPEGIKVLCQSIQDHFENVPQECDNEYINLIEDIGWVFDTACMTELKEFLRRYRWHPRYKPLIARAEAGFVPF